MIRRLHVQNFKSLADVQLPLGTRNVLVGPNMAGKSNILSVFRFLSRMVLPNPSGGGLEGALNAFGGFAEVAWKGGDSDVISISLEGDLPPSHEGGDRPSWEYRIEIHGNRRQPATPLVRDEALMLSGPAGRVTLIERDAKTGNRALRNTGGAHVAMIQDTWRSALEFEIPNWEGEALRRLLVSSRFYTLRPERMRQINAAAGALVLEPDGGNLSAWLLTLASRHREAFDKVQAAAGHVLPHLAGLYPYPTPQAQVFLASRENGLTSDIPVWQMSDGELCFIALLSLIFAPGELAAPLYCAEEPENHLHPRLLETLTELLRQRQQELGPGAAQVLVSTHSPTLVDKTDLSELVIVDKRDGATVCRRPGDKAELRALLDEAGLGELYFSGALGGA